MEFSSGTRARLFKLPPRSLHLCSLANLMARLYLYICLVIFFFYFFLLVEYHKQTHVSVFSFGSGALGSGQTDSDQH